MEPVDDTEFVFYANVGSDRATKYHWRCSAGSWDDDDGDDLSLCQVPISMGNYSVVTNGMYVYVAFNLRFTCTVASPPAGNTICNTQWLTYRLDYVPFNTVHTGRGRG